MIINENTKVMARLHPACNNRGLNIYNPYFQSAGVNAVYLLFHNEDPKVLIDGIRALNLPGAVIAGSFEGDPRIPSLIDELNPISKKINRVGVLVNRAGKIWGVYQGAFGLDESIKRLTDYRDKKVVILGAGTVVRGLLSLMEINKYKAKVIEIYNRTPSKAEAIGREFSFVNRVGSMKDMELMARGDIFINATYLGSPWNKGENYVFTEDFINRFKYVVDVTFVPLKPQLVQTAEKLGKVVSPGYKMFLYQGKYALENILNIDVNEKLLEEKMVEDFKVNWS